MELRLGDRLRGVLRIREQGMLEAGRLALAGRKGVAASSEQGSKKNVVVRNFFSSSNYKLSVKAHKSVSS